MLAVKWALQSESHYRLEAALSLAKSTLPIADAGDCWNSDICLLGVPNGVVDLRTGRLRPAKQKDRITMYARAPFDPAAQCPRFERFLAEVFLEDVELIAFVQQAIGYCLTGSVTEQCLFLCYGQGANGKSTLLEVIRYILGDYAHNLPFSAFELQGNRSPSAHELAGLVSKRFVTSVETNESVRLNEGRVKALTGGDCITARFLYGEYFTFEPTGKFWLAFNHKPQVGDTSHGFWRRVRLIPFYAEFREGAKDPQLLARLRDEGPGILAWAVRGCLLWHANGLPVPRAIEAATKDYRDESDPVAEFIEERYERCPDGFVESSVLHANYAAWADANGAEPLDRRTLGNRLRAIGLVSARAGHTRVRGWAGIRERTAQEIPPADMRTDADGKIQ
jgi:putative DNA primase/helicase